MPDPFHPVDALLPVEFYLPRPGTKEPFAILRYVDVVLDGEPTSRWRAVTYQEPRRLIGNGYFRELEDAAMAAHKLAIFASIRPELDETRR